MSFEGHVRNGKKEGKCKTWSVSGHQTADWEVLDGKEHGFIQCWYDNGIKKREGEVVKGIKTGLEKVWYENGKPASEGPQETPSMATANTGSNPIQWPDPSASAAQLKSQPIAHPANTASPKPMICIMRDVNGRDHVVTVDSPPTELVDAIHRQASR